MRIASVDELPPQMRDQARRMLADLENVIVNGTSTNPNPPVGLINPESLVSVVLPKKRSKYRNNVVHFEGERYDSQLELDMCLWLRERRARGEVVWFIRQVGFRLEGGVTYRCDALAVLRDAPFIEVLDAKGILTQASKNKIKQVRDRYGFDVKLWRRSGIETIQARGDVR